MHVFAPCAAGFRRQTTILRILTLCTFESNFSAMKYLFSLVLALLVTTGMMAQQNDITIFEKKDGNSNIVVARNTGKVPYLVTVDITSEGMMVAPGKKAQAIVPAGHMKEMATLTPIPGSAWSYGYEVSYMESTGQTSIPATTTGDAPEIHDADINENPSTEVQLTDAAIVMYSKPGCSRCATVKKELNARGIKFEEFSTTSGSPEINHMWKALRDGGFTGDSVTMPVMRVNGKYHYNIKDLVGFVKGL